MGSWSTAPSSSGRTGLPRGHLLEELPGQVPTAPAWRGSWARRSSFTGLPASIRRLRRCSGTADTHPQGSFALSLRQLRSKGFPPARPELSAPRRISPARPRRAPKPCLSSHGWVPADPGHLAVGSGLAPSCFSQSFSHLSPNQEKKQHPELVNINELCKWHAQHQCRHLTQPFGDPEPGTGRADAPWRGDAPAHQCHCLTPPRREAAPVPSVSE